MQPSNAPAVALQKPQHIISMATASILVDVDINVWTATKQDRALSDEVTTAKHASDKAARVVKNLLVGSVSHKDVLNFRQTVYNWMQRCTYDWSRNQRALPHVNLPRFQKEYAELEAEFYRRVDTFCNEYPTLVSNMAFKMSGQGDMFNRADYPDVSEVRNKFNMRLITSEVPLGDFRCQIAQDLADDLFKHYSSQTERIVQDILKQQTSQLVEVMESISHCCENEEVTDKDGNAKVKRRKIYDTTVQRAIQLCETFQSFNPTGDATLEKARAALARTLSGTPIESLRESDAVRSRVKDDIDNILSLFNPTPATSQ